MKLLRNAIYVPYAIVLRWERSTDKVVVSHCPIPSYLLIQSHI